ncbi:type IX secretion system membrane protein PorP/SprF [Tenacibaculum sp. IB213877]|uniref:PorP/SprF family type IX secretion system membrane protein n=1 Tax=Tenacibaculum sp. IB213877 TaxID=3097351 RepID=UPI002A5A9176|nr:type IX secretion system membrane protein PorP/SprF [Tenacibaculum sp. IB213877]MDY0781024.1 type IX secretion system membrane protein PorP/SprF [Tenacibaculum sp. IB213877]
MKHIIINIVFVGIFLTAFENLAQQYPMYTQYYNNLSLLNPAYAGSHKTLTGIINIRSQWVNEIGAPETKTFSLHTPTGKNIGLGLSIVKDEIYVLDETHVYADFSYSIYPSERSILAFGLKAGGTFLNVDLLKLGITEDPLFTQNISEFNPNFAVGAFFYTNNFYTSLSITNILQHKNYNRKSYVVTSASEEMVFYLSSGYVFSLSETVKLKPSFMLRMMNETSTSTDIAANVLWNNKLEFGISHRINESISGLFQIKVTNNLKFGYSYDAVTTKISKNKNASHEFSIILNLQKNTRSYKEDISAPFYWMNN